MRNVFFRYFPRYLLSASITAAAVVVRAGTFLFINGATMTMLCFLVSSASTFRWTFRHALVIHTT